tara:strand:+ start:108 stop:314 length:207 start_codon:yes stop_codon:yes gene_type:complete
MLWAALANVTSDAKTRQKSMKKWSLRLTNKYLALIDNPVTATPIDFQQPDHPDSPSPPEQASSSEKNH